MQLGEMSHFFNTPHAFKKIGETQHGEMPHTQMHDPHTLIIKYNPLILKPNHIIDK